MYGPSSRSSVHELQVNDLSDGYAVLAHYDYFGTSASKTSDMFLIPSRAGWPAVSVFLMGKAVFLSLHPSL